uniref:Uncharacterized protein n=1 Tax=Timema bartmani TaxID=61472 RepID=A0A7R9I4D3_9NEOP|nr:unnamed protein product [Timema bartmani]
MLRNDVETFAHSNDKRTHLELAGDGTKGVNILDPAPARGGGPPPGKGRGGKKNKNKGSRCNRTSTMAPTSGEVTESVDQDVELLADE